MFSQKEKSLKRIFQVTLFSALLGLSSCNYLTQLKDSKIDCPSKPTKLLSSELINQIELDDKNFKRIQLESTEAVSEGAVFVAKATQKLVLDKQVLGCYFVFTPDGTLLYPNDNQYELPIDGKYVIQAESSEITLLLKILPTIRDRRIAQNKVESEKLTQQSEKLLFEGKSVIPDLTKAINLNPNNGYAYYIRALSYYNQQKYKEAEFDFNKALGLGINRLEIYYYRGSSKFKQGKKSQAISDLTRVITSPVANIETEVSETSVSLYGKAQAFFMRGEAFFSMGQYRKAISDFTEVTKIQSPLIGQAFYRRGVCYSKLGQHINAITDFSSAIDVGYSSANVIEALEKSQNIVDKYTTQGAKIPNDISSQLSSGIYRDIFIENDCSEDFRIALRAQTNSGSWQTFGFWNLSGYENTYLLINGRRIQSNIAKIYLYAESASVLSRADTFRYLNGERLPMQEYQMEVDSDGKYVISLSCN